MEARTVFVAVLGALGAAASAIAVSEGVPLLAVASAALLAALVVAYHWRHALGSHRPPPGTPVVPGALPLIGNAHQIMPNISRVHDWVLEQQRAIGGGFKTFSFTLPFMRTFISITHPAVLEWVLKTRAENYVKGQPFRDNFGPLLGRGIFVSDGEEWRWQRKLATRIFSVRSFKQYMAEVFGAKADLLMARLAAACRPLSPAAEGVADPTSGATPTSRTAPIDLHDLMYRFTLDTFCRIGFGTDPDCLATEGLIPFAVAFDRAQRTTAARFWMPGWPLMELLDGRARQLRKDVATVRSFAASMIDTRRVLLAKQQQQQQQQQKQQQQQQQQHVEQQEWQSCSEGTETTTYAGEGATEQLQGSCKAFGGKEGGERPAAPPSPGASSSSSTFEIISRGDGGMCRSSDGADVSPVTDQGPDDDHHAEQQQRHHHHHQQQEQQQEQEQQRRLEGPGRAPAAAADGGDLGDSSAPRDLLALFLTESGPDGAPLGDEALADTVLNFIIAGRDTTAQALSWTLYHVLQRPDVERKLLEEAAAVLGGGALGAKPTYDQMHDLKYARAVFLEGLRLHPSVPENAKFAVRADVLPDGTRVPAGALMHYSAYSINRVREFWGQDADEFRPERWLEFAHAPSPYSCISFNAGPRICLGQRLAELEGVFVLVMVLRRFKLRAVEGQSVTYDLSASMPMKSGLWATVEERG